MRKKISILLLCMITAVTMIFAFTGCSDEFIDEVASVASEVAKTTEETTIVTSEATTIASETDKTTDTSDVVAEQQETTTAASETTSTTIETAIEETSTVSESVDLQEELLDIDGSYTTKDDVSLYIYQYGKLPSNFITKKEARALGWEGGSLEDFAPGKCIGGDYFGNYEGLLPEASGRTYYECDIDTLGASSRGAKRIIFSDDGLIYYTSDHYESFTLLYGEE